MKYFGQRSRPKEKVFEQKAKKILQYLKSPQRYDPNFLPRPFFLEFTGSPSAGKTTTITELDKFLRRYGFRVLRPQEGAEVIRHISRTTPLYNIRTGLYALCQLIDLAQSHLYDVVIFDRCIFDTFGWMMYWEEKEQLEAWEKRDNQEFFLSRFWVNNIDSCYIMTCQPEVAMERELRIALSQKLGETTNPDTIRQLVERYKTTYETLSPRFPQLHFLDTSNLDEQTMVEVIAMDILSILENSCLRSK